MGSHFSIFLRNGVPLPLFLCTVKPCTALMQSKMPVGRKATASPPSSIWYQKKIIQAVIIFVKGKNTRLEIRPLHPGSASGPADGKNQGGYDNEDHKRSNCQVAEIRLRDAGRQAEPEQQSHTGEKQTSEE